MPDALLDVGGWRGHGAQDRELGLGILDPFAHVTDVVAVCSMNVADVLALRTLAPKYATAPIEATVPTLYKLISIGRWRRKL